MWMSLLLILLCIQRSFTIELAKIDGRIEKESDDPKVGNNFKDETFKQKDTQETEYEYEELGDKPDIDRNSLRYDDGKIVVNNNRTSNNSISHTFVRLIRAALPIDNSSKIEEVETDGEEDEEFEDSENGGSTEEQDDGEVYDSVPSTNRGKNIAGTDRSKRLPIHAKKGIVSTSLDPIEIGEEESLNENYGEEYDDFFPTRKERMTVRTRQRRSTFKSSPYQDIVSSRRFKFGKAKDNLRVASESNDTKQITKKSLLHGKKGKTPKYKDKIKGGKSQEECDFEELKKAYNALVCSVENFMELANKSVQNKLDDLCKTQSTSPCPIFPPVATYCKTDSKQTTFDWCPSSSSSKHDCTSTTCDDSDFDSGERFRKSEDDDEGSIMRKKQKGIKVEYPTSDYAAEKPGAYAYDYDSIDPNEYDTNISVKSSMSSPSMTIRSTPSSSSLSSSQVTESKKTEPSTDVTKKISSTVTENITTKEASSTSKSSYSTYEITKEPKITWSTFHYETRNKMRPSRRQARRMSTESQKILSRRKYHFARRRDQKYMPKEVITQSFVTKYPMLKNLSPGQDGDTEIIEVEYL